MAATSRADSTQTFALNKIILVGNRSTKSYIILRELPFKEGDRITDADVAYARERVYSTGLFTKVLTQTALVSKYKKDLLIYVEERWYIWPYPIVGFRDRVVSWNRLYAGLGILDMNFSGLADKLAGMFALGYDPFVSITYNCPSIGENKNYLVWLGANYAHGQNLGLQSGYSSGQFDNSFGELYVGMGKRLNVYSVVSMWTAYNYVARNSADSNSAALSPNGKDVFASVQFEYNFDSRDLKVYATEGTYVDFILEKDGLGESLVDFGRASFDLREYLPVSDFFYLAGRVHGSFAEGPEIPKYDHVFYGYGERIRGMFNEIIEGESVLGGNLEARIPIVKSLYLELPWSPLEEFRSNRFGLYGEFFGDVGETSNKNLNLILNGALYGYGAGLAFLLPYDLIFQIDYARGSDRHFEFIFDFGETI